MKRLGEVLVLLPMVLMALSLSSCTQVKVYFCPADSCQAQVVEELYSASESVYFMAYSLTDGKIADALIKKSGKIIVRGVMEKQMVNGLESKYYTLADNGIDVVTDKNRALMHNKVFVIDRSTVITGSYNPTKNGNENNNENMLIIRDKKIAEMYIEEFERLAGD